MISSQVNNAEKWKGLLLAGGTGSRLYPSTKTTNKHLLSVYDKPLVYYSLTTLMLSGIKDIVVVSSETSIPSIQNLLGDGAQWGITLTYRDQKEPKGIADGINAATDVLRGYNTALALGDNIFYGAGLSRILQDARLNNDGATIFGYPVKDPTSFGVVSIDAENKAVALEEKPENPKSNLAVPGLYFYDTNLLNLTHGLKPSSRGELEITDVNQAYLDRKKLKVSRLGRGIAWLDAGTTHDLFEAAQFVKVFEERTGTKIACPEEVAWRQKWIGSSDFETLTYDLPNSNYKDYLSSILRYEVHAS